MQEEIDARPRAGTFLSSIANYSTTIPSPGDPDAKPQRGGARMGTLVGVYLPCIQNIFGVILFIRLPWVVGTAGAVCGFIIVLTCCCVVSYLPYLPSSLTYFRNMLLYVPGHLSLVQAERSARYFGSHVATCEFSFAIIFWLAKTLIAAGVGVGLPDDVREIFLPLNNKISLKCKIMRKSRIFPNFQLTTF